MRPRPNWYRRFRKSRSQLNWTTRMYRNCFYPINRKIILQLEQRTVQPRGRSPDMIKLFPTLELKPRSTRASLPNINSNQRTPLFIITTHFKVLQWLFLQRIFWNLERARVHTARRSRSPRVLHIMEKFFARATPLPSWAPRVYSIFNKYA